MTHTQTLSTSIEINDGVPLMSGIRKGCNGFKAEPEFPGACSDASEVFEGLAFEVKVPYYHTTTPSLLLLRKLFCRKVVRSNKLPSTC